MNIKQIECFNALAKTLNFTKAAELVYITQPAFSRMIASMEEELGCQLLIRSKTSPKLTPAGERIYEKTRVIIENYKEMTKIADFAANGKLGNFRIGILTNGLTSHMTDVISGFMKENVSVNIELDEYSEVELYLALNAGLVDAAFMVHSPEDYKDIFNCIIIETYNNCLLVHKDHPLASRKSVTVSELKDEEFVVLKQEKSEIGYNFILNTCLKNGFRPKIVAQADSVAGLISYINCKVGITIMTDAVSRFSGSDIAIIQIESLEPCDNMLVWKKESNKPIIDSFVKYAQLKN